MGRKALRHVVRGHRVLQISVDDVNKGLDEALYVALPLADAGAGGVLDAAAHGPVSTLAISAHGVLLQLGPACERLGHGLGGLVARHG